MRGRLIDLLSPIGQIDCAGKFRHNTDELLEVYGDDKFKFLANYRFNLCPENSLGEGYITEKVFDSIRSGCIPIYWGAYLEPGILNPKAILRFEEGKEQEFYNRVKELWEDEEAYEQFILEPPFVEGAAERIWEILEGLRERLAPLSRVIPTPARWRDNTAKAAYTPVYAAFASSNNSQIRAEINHMYYLHSSPRPNHHRGQLYDKEDDERKRLTSPTDVSIYRNFSYLCRS